MTKVRFVVRLGLGACGLCLLLSSAVVGQQGRPPVISTLNIVAIDGAQPKAVYTAHDYFEAPNWTRDGASLVFDEGGKIVQIPVGGGAPKTLEAGQDMRCNGSHGLSPDGKLLAISCTSTERPGTRVYLMPLHGGTPKVVTENPNSYWHSWSPDGKTLIFTRPDHGSLNLFAIPASGGEEKPLTTGTGTSDDPDCSPDGKYIYFNSDRAGGMQIWRMHPDGTAPEQITFDDLPNWTPHPSPDGKWIVFLTYEKGVTGHPANKNIMLRLMSLRDRKVKVLVKLVGGSGTINVPSWSPDSKQLAYVSYELLPPPAP